MKLKAILILLAVLAVAGTTYLFIKPKVHEAEQPIKYYVWDFPMDALQHIVLTLPKTNQSESFIKHADDRNFYFDVANGPKVDMQRWGGGIPLLLSGPGATRLIVQGASATQLTEYGFDSPNMTAALIVTTDGVDKEVDIVVGDANPEATTYYVKLASNSDVYTVDSSWFDVLSKIVTDPPYVPGTLVVDNPTATPSPATAGSPVTISVNVTNAGDVIGTFDVTLIINSEPLDTQTITMDPRASQIVSFTVTEKTPGNYVASINAKHNVTFTVK